MVAAGPVGGWTVGWGKEDELVSGSTFDLTGDEDGAGEVVLGCDAGPWL